MPMTKVSATLPTDLNHDLTAFATLDTTGLSITAIAELLRDHGAGHLSLIERIELAERLTRRRFIIGAGTLGIGIEARSEALITQYDQRAADIRAKLAPRWAGAPFAVLGGWEVGKVNLATTGEILPMILANDLGMVPVKATIDAYDPAISDFSFEHLDRIEDARLIVWRVGSQPNSTACDRQFIDPVLSSPLWQQLPAVEAGAVYEVDSEINYPSFFTAMAILDAVELMLA